MNAPFKFGIKIGLGALFAGAIVAYAFVQPFEPDAVRGAIPYGASFVFKAESLGDLLQSPVRGQLDKALGAGNSLREIAESSAWTKQVAAAEIAVADIPFRSAGARKSWAAASWVGWRSPWLRWRLEHARDDRLDFMGKHSVWPVWRYDAPDIARGMSLTFALTDNLFIVCLSESPTDIFLLLDTYDGRHPAARHDKG